MHRCPGTVCIGIIAIIQNADLAVELTLYTGPCSVPVHSFRNPHRHYVNHPTSVTLSLVLADCMPSQSTQLDWLYGMMLGMGPSLLPSL